MARIFVSYSRADKAKVKKLIPLLREVYGHENVWWDEDFVGGHVWWAEIIRRIAWCEVFLYVMSPRSISSPYCRAEYEEATRIHKPILPVKLGRGEHWIPEKLVQLHYVDLSHQINRITVPPLLRAINEQVDIPLSAALPLTETPSPLPIVPPSEPRNFLADYTKEIVISIVAAIISGVILAFIIQADRFAPKTDESVTRAVVESQIDTLDATQGISADNARATGAAQAYATLTALAPTDTPTITPTPTNTSISSSDIEKTAQAEIFATATIDAQTQAVIAQETQNIVLTEQFIAGSTVTYIAQLSLTPPATIIPTNTSICLITDIGKINDATFNQFAYEGMFRAVVEFGLEHTFIETQSPSDYENNINTCVSSEYDIIITVGFALADATRAASIANPNIYFIGIDQDFSGVDPLANLVGLQFREDQAGFLAGAMAALMTESNTVGGVYGLDIPPVVKFRNGFEQGVKYIDPEINILGIYIPDFQRPDLGAENAAQFIGQGVDVIFGAGGPTGSGAIAYAAAEGILVIGVDQDEYFTTFGEGEAPGSENLITSAMKRIDNGVYDMIAAIFEGEGFPENSVYVLEVANDGIDFAPAHDANIPDEVTEQVTAIKEGLRDGSIETGVDPISGVILETD